MSHTCHAVWCESPIPPRMFMCPKHWAMVPDEMQQAIWHAYVPGQERRKDPSMEYLEAALAARGYVAELEAGNFTRAALAGPADDTTREAPDG